VRAHQSRAIGLRGLYNRYHRLGWIGDDEHDLLRSVLDTIPSPVPTILLIPAAEVVKERLSGRTAQNVRGQRDQFFAREDPPEFTHAPHAASSEFTERPNVLLLRDNDEKELQKVTDLVLNVN
jgi:hypothetical protein